MQRISKEDGREMSGSGEKKSVVSPEAARGKYFEAEVMNRIKNCCQVEFGEFRELIVHSAM